MKKLLAAAIAALTVFSLSTTAFAAETGNHADVPDFTTTDIDVPVQTGAAGTLDTTLPGNTTEEIEQSIVDLTGHESTPKVYVEVEWEKLEFIYDFGTVIDYDWDVNRCEYVPIFRYEHGESKGWIDNEAKITFTSYSNRDVYVGVLFEKNTETDIYDDIQVTFDKREALLLSAVGRGKENADFKEFTMMVDGAPADELKYFEEKGSCPVLGYLKFYISEEARAEDASDDTNSENDVCIAPHKHHMVYDQFGHLVCTYSGCKYKHTECIDMDSDDICDECGLERDDFCPDCHVGGRCICL